MKTYLTLTLTAALGAALVVPAAAHHSFAMFDRSKTVVIEGTVKSMQWSNPHSWLRVVGSADKGAVKDWAIEGPSPNLLLRMGWKQSDIKAGDRVAVTINPLKDGSDGGVIQSVRLASGKTISGDPRPASLNGGGPPGGPGGGPPGGGPPGGPPPPGLPPPPPQ